jgi:DNA ligase-1
MKTVLRPMLAATLKDLSLLPNKAGRFKQTVQLQPKYDGVRAIYDISTKSLYSRNGNELHLPHITEYLNRRVTLGSLTCSLDGELICPGSNFDEISSIVSRGVNNPHPYIKNVIYVVFDAITTPMHYLDRYKFIQRIFPTPFKSILGKSPYNIATTPAIDYGMDIPLVTTTLSLSVESIQQTRGMVATFLDNGWEGVMFRLGNCPYTLNKRSKNLLKYKEVKYLTAIVEKVLPGKSKYSATMGSLLCKMPHSEATFNVGSGFTDLQRKEWWEVLSQQLPLEIKVQYQELTKNGIPRFPVYTELLGSKA